MSWKDNKAIERIFNTFKRNNKVIFQQDVDALKQLKESIEESEKKLTRDNILYAKLVCHMIRLNLMYYKDIKLAITETGFNLKQPLEYHLELLTKVLNENDINNYINQNENSSLKDKSFQDEFLNKLNTNWALDKVAVSFYKTANDFLKDIDNYI